MEGKNYFKLGQRAFVLGNLQESSKMFSKALGLEYEPAKTLLSRGAVYLVAEKYGSALADFNLVLEIGGDNERAYFYRGIAYLRKHRYEEAAADFDAALLLNATRGTAYFARGVAWTMLGNKNRALADFEQAVAHAHLETGRLARIFGPEPVLMSRFVDFWQDQDAEALPKIFTETEIRTIRNWT